MTGRGKSETATTTAPAPPGSAAPDGSHPDPATRAALGAQARARVPLASHAEFVTVSDRPDPVEVLIAQAASRVVELVPIRHGRMLVSPFTFYRGAAAVMAADLAATRSSGLTCQLCGDAHLSNFGAFGSPERRLVFDVNDFDETSAGPWEWDIKRLAASFVVAARERGFGRKQRGEIVATTVGRYRQAMAEFATMRELQICYPTRTATSSRRRSAACWPGTDAASMTTAGICSTRSSSSTWPARWWVWEASAPGAGSACYAGATTGIRCCFRSRRRSGRSSPTTSRTRAGTCGCDTKGSGSSPASA